MSCTFHPLLYVVSRFFFPWCGGRHAFSQAHGRVSVGVVVSVMSVGDIWSSFSIVEFPGVCLSVCLCVSFCVSLCVYLYVSVCVCLCVCVWKGGRASVSLPPENME